MIVRNKKNELGFTLIEMLVVTAVSAILAMVSISNFRAAERQKSVNLAVDGITNALNLAQTYTLSGKSTTNSSASCRKPEYYYVQISYTNSYTIYARNTCGTDDSIQTFPLPDKVRIKASGLLLNGTSASTNIRISYSVPFAQAKASRDVGTFAAFTSAQITVQSTNSSKEKSVYIDGIVGRISN
jgi:prepilin-type N-terminal cleavage/methylation domain-containing protein